MAAPAVAARIERGVWLTWVGSNALGVSVILVEMVAAQRVFPGQWPSTGSVLAKVMPAAVGWFGMACLVGRWQIRSALGTGLDWLGVDATPTERQQRDLYAAPTKCFLHAVPWWVLPGLWLPLFMNLIDLSVPTRLFWKALILLFLGLVSANSIGFLLVERRLRPVFAASLRAETPVEPVGLGVARRLLVVWFASAATPLLAVAALPVASTFEERADIWPAVFVAAIGATIVGFVVTLLAGRSLQEPLRAMQAALRQVEQGELDVEIQVADASEVGLVQAGFNRTVQSLRERDRLRELFGHHVGAHVAEHALAAERSLGGEVRKVSVLFVDVVASTALSQRQAPTTVVKKLNAFFDVVVKAVEAEGGWVNKFEGDAALCIFGAPGELVNHAECALRAAKRMRIDLVKLGKRYGDIDAAIGVATGEVVAGNIGAAHRYEYTVIGDAVNEASRLTDEAKTRNCRVLATSDAIAAAGDATWVREGRKKLRGRAEATVFYSPGSMG